MKSEESLCVRAVGCLFFAVLCSGCVHQTFYLQQVEMSGPLVPPPVHLTERQQGGEVRLSPVLAYSVEERLTGQVLNQQAQLSDPPVTAKRTGGVTWNIPRVTVGTDVQYFVSDHVGFAGGLSYTGVGGSSFWEGHLGIGLCTTGENVGVRLDGGVQWRSFLYSVQALVVTDVEPWSSSVGVTTLADVWKESQAGFYCALTLNTCYDASVVNGFLSFGLTRHSLGDLSQMRYGAEGGLFHSGYVDNAETGLWMLSLTPGVSFTLGQHERVMLGARFMTALDLEQPDPEFLLIPFLQIDLSF